MGYRTRRFHEAIRYSNSEEAKERLGRLKRQELSDLESAESFQPRRQAALDDELTRQDRRSDLLAQRARIEQRLREDELREQQRRQQETEAESKRVEARSEQARRQLGFTSAHDDPRSDLIAGEVRQGELSRETEELVDLQRRTLEELKRDREQTLRVLEESQARKEELLNRVESIERSITDRNLAY